MRTFDIVVWVVFIAASLFLFFFFQKRIKKNKIAKLEAQKAYEAKREKYQYLTPESFDDMPREDVTAAVLFHCTRKENEDFDHYYENMTESERLVHGIYQLTLSLSDKNPSLHSFFLSPSNQVYVPHIAEYFERIGSHDIAELLIAAKKFADIIENDEEDEDMGDYSKYNFSDFTNEFITLVNTTNVNEKLTKYVLEHKEEFYDEVKEESGDNDETISE